MTEPRKSEIRLMGDHYAVTRDGAVIAVVVRVECGWSVISTVSDYGVAGPLPLQHAIREARRL